MIANQRLFVSSLVAAPVIALVGWRISVPRPAPVHALILYDRSESFHEPCKALANAVWRSIELSAGRQNSTLTILATGASDSASEPVVLLSEPIFTNRRLMKSKKKAQGERRAFVTGIEERCQSLPSSRMSPLRSNLERALQQLKSLDPPNAERHLIFTSDLLETVDGQVQKLLQRPPKKVVLPRFDNTDIASILLCGYAQRVGPRSVDGGLGRRTANLPRGEQLVATWRTFFSKPAQVHFKPYCSAPNGKD
jgi:hypothetical protein